MARGFPRGRSHSRHSYRFDKQVPLMRKWTSAQRQITKKLHNRKVRRAPEFGGQE